MEIMVFLNNGQIAKYGNIIFADVAEGALFLSRGTSNYKKPVAGIPLFSIMYWEYSYPKKEDE